ncbi:hypothetical protein [Micromonospora sp. URMC 103]|uniref:hypothetical protein n=1 Tax=Micromonospora sp. URMC 103 TaxID=3423406 RepID=UPI003F1C838F
MSRAETSGPDGPEESAEPARSREPTESGEPDQSREPAASRDETEHPERIQARPTANPARVRMPPEGPSRKKDEGDPEESGPPPGEEG